jgi:hypothetical protein
MFPTKKFGDLGEPTASPLSRWRDERFCEVRAVNKTLGRLEGALSQQCRARRRLFRKAGHARELMIAVPAAVIFGLLARRGALFVDAGLGAALSGLSVVFALAVLQFQCMFQRAPHLLVWHGVTAALLIGLGGLIGRWQRHRWISYS